MYVCTMYVQTYPGVPYMYSLHLTASIYREQVQLWVIILGQNYYILHMYMPLAFEQFFSNFHGRLETNIVLVLYM